MECLASLIIIGLSYAVLTTLTRLNIIDSDSL